MNKIFKYMYVNDYITDINDVYKIEKVYLFDQNFHSRIYYIGYYHTLQRGLLNSNQITTDNISNSYIFFIKNKSYLYFDRITMDDKLALSLIRDYRYWYYFRYIGVDKIKYIKRVNYTNDIFLNLFILYAIRYTKCDNDIWMKNFVLKSIESVNSIELLNTL